MPDAVHAIEATISKQRRLVAQLRKATRTEATNIAKAAGISPSTFTRSLSSGATNALSVRSLAKLAEFASGHGFDLDIAALTLRDKDGNEIEIEGEGDLGRRTRRAVQPAQTTLVAPAVHATHAVANRQDTVPGRDGRALPIKGRVYDAYVSGESGGQAVVVVIPPQQHERQEDVDCPPWLLGDTDAYALNILTSALAPALLTGDVVYVSTQPRPLRAGEIVIVLDKQPANRSGAPAAQVGLFVERVGNTFRFRLPDGEPSEIDAENIEYVHRVVGICRN